MHKKGRKSYKKSRSKNTKRAYIATPFFKILIYNRKTLFTMLKNIQLILSLMILSLCIFGGITLIAHPQHSKAKFILGLSMLFWALLISIRLIINPFLDNTALFQPIVLITGSYVMATTTCYIIEILRPGYLTFKRFCFFISPAIGFTLLFGSYYIFKQEVTVYHGMQDLLSLSDIDIIFRITLLLCNMLYMIIPAYLTFRYNNEYTQLLKENVSNPDDYDLYWLKRIMIVLSALYIFYFILLVTHNTILYVINKVFILILWYYFFYKALFLKEIPWKISFAAGWKTPSEENIPEKDWIYDQAKTNYLQAINQWFQTEKPYLYRDLRLSDLQRKFPISRTYLSQLFNKELGVSFSDYVNQFRVQESKHLLETEPQTEITDIAERSGFNSTCTFRRAFIKYMKISPSEYKKIHRLNT